MELEEANTYVGIEECKNCVNSLLCMFLNYAWDDSDDPDEHHPECKARGMTRWLASVDLDVNRELWYASAVLDVRTAPKIAMTGYVKSNEALLREARDSNNKRMYAEIAYGWQIIFPTLIKCNDNVNYVNGNGHTVLHLFIAECILKTGEFSQDQLVRVQNMIDRLIARKASFFANDRDGITPLHFATIDYTEILRIIIASLPDVRESDSFGNTGLHILLRNCVKNCVNHENNYAHLVRILVGKGAYVNAKNHKGVTPVHLAAENFHTEVLKFFACSGANFDDRTNDGETPLQIACKSSPKLVDWGKIVKTFDFLVAQGCDPKVVDKEGRTLLQLAAEFGHVEIVGKLIVLHSNFDDPTVHGFTLLQLAVVSRDMDKVKVLIANGADVNFHRDALDLTPLHLAVIVGDFEIAKSLLEHGAVVNQRGSVERMTALHMVLIQDVHWQLGKYEERRGNVSYFKKYFAKGDAKPVPERRRIVSLLLERGADVNVRDASGKTPLHYAALFRVPDLMIILLDAGAHVNVQDRTGKLSIHNAWKKNEKEGLKLLLEFGADINDVDTSEMFMGSFDDMRTLAVDHARKLRMLGLPIAKVYEPLIANLKSLHSHVPGSREELTRLISHCDADGFSLYKFLRMNPKFQCHYIERIQNTYWNLEEIFPIFGGLFRGICRESAIRRQLLEPARTAWVKNSGVRLPDVCVELILDQLNNRYLDVLGRVNEIEKV